MYLNPFGQVLSDVYNWQAPLLLAYMNPGQFDLREQNVAHLPIDEIDDAPAQVDSNPPSA